MKKILLLNVFVLVLMFSVQTASFAWFGDNNQNPPKAQAVAPAGQPVPAALPAVVGPKKLIAVAEFENKTNWSGQVNLGTGMADQLITSLMNTGRYTVLERDNIQGVLKEQDFAASGRTTAEGGAKIGQINRAQILIQGAITEFGSQGGGGGGVNIKGFTLGGSSAEAVVGVDVRVYDTTTGQVLASKACRGVAKSSGSAIGYSGGDFGFATGGESRTPMDFAVRAAIQQAVDFITIEASRVPWAGRVAMFKDGLIYINAGRENGIQIGDRFDVFKEGEAVVDPDSGMTLGSEMTRAGDVEVVAVEEKFSKATPISGTVFEKNNIVKMKVK